MKKWIVLLLILVARYVLGQQAIYDVGPVHKTPLSITVPVTGDSTVSVWVQFPGRGGDEGGKIDTLAYGETVATGGWDTDRAVYWSGELEVDVKITNVDLATDSLQIRAYSLDKDGATISNDHVDCDFGTPPTYSETTKANGWTTATLYRSSLTAAFGKGTFGILFVIDMNDATTGHTGTMIFKANF